MIITSKKIIVVDLESTCWNGPTTEISEIIEIGICELDAETGEISKARGIIIKPVKSKISKFCTELTTITQDMVDTEGISLGEAFSIIENEYDLKNNNWISYGEYDYNMFIRDSKNKSLGNPFLKNHINIKSEFARLNKLRKKGVGLRKALSMCKLEFDGTHHRGVDDAKNIAKLVYKIIKNKND